MINARAPTAPRCAPQQRRQHLGTSVKPSLRRSLQAPLCATPTTSASADPISSVTKSFEPEPVPELPVHVPAPMPADYKPITEATPEILQTWMHADAICFDVDCTITVNDSLDVLAEFMGCKEQVEALTNQAMDGSMSLEFSLAERLSIIDCKPDDLKLFHRAYPPQSRLAPNIEGLIKALQARGKAIYLISGGFRELILPIAAHLGIPKENVFANRMQWQWDDVTGAPTSLAGFDPNQPTSRNNGKVEAIAQIRAQNPYNTVVMIGDGITDLEAVQTTHGADLFIGYGGVIERPSVASASEWYVYDFEVLAKSLKRMKVALLGAGPLATATARLIAQNTLSADPAQEFVDEVVMYVPDEDYEGGKLSERINETRENPRYLPGVNLGPNVIAVGNLAEAVQGADLLVFCAPHHTLGRMCKQLVGKVKNGAIAISLAKGMDVRPEGPQLVCQMVRRFLGIDCSVLAGGTLAEDIAREDYCEAVIGYTAIENGETFKKLFQRPYFRVSLLPDPLGAEMCGTLKNIVALGAGIVDGMGMGSNSKSIVIKQGLAEIRSLCQALFPQVREETFYEVCGVGDVVASCYSGNNWELAQEWTKRQLAGTPTTFFALETELLEKGTQLQGVTTSNELQGLLAAKGWESKYPLFTTVNAIINGRVAPALLFKGMDGQLEEAEPTENNRGPRYSASLL